MNESQTHDALNNAARIAFELGLRGTLEDIYAHLETVQAAARGLAAIEARQRFQWNEGRVSDWETACARIAERIENKQSVSPVNLRHCCRA